MKRSYNFLRNGCLFFYRGIFSGLSNEAGTVSYNFWAHLLFAVTQCSKGFQHYISFFLKLKLMNNTAPNLVAIVVKYDKPLQRYARFLVKDAAIAATLVKNVLELVYDENGFAVSENELRRQLKNYTLTACRYWQQVHAAQTALNN